MPPEIHPGIDYVAYGVDPDGHMIQLYYYMEQIGWSGKPRPQETAAAGAGGLAGEAGSRCPTLTWTRCSRGRWGRFRKIKRKKVGAGFKTRPSCFVWLPEYPTSSA